MSLAADFLLLGLTTAIVAPIAKRFVKRRLIRWGPVAFELLDRELPQLFGQYSGAEITAMVRSRLEALTGESWSDADLDQVFELYDPRITADHAINRPNS